MSPVTRRAAWAAGIVVVTAIGAWRVAASNVVDGPIGPAGTGGAPAANAALPGQAPAAAMPDADASAALAQQRVAELLQGGSLRGTELDGDWGTWTGDALQPSRSLRRRFDYLLTGLGEVQPAQLRSWIAAQVSAQRGAAGAAQVLAVWDRYMLLLQSSPQSSPDLSSDEGFQRALAEKTAQRNALLGPAWTQAFYAEEASETAAFLARRGTQRAVAAAAAGSGTAPTAMAPDAMTLIAPPTGALTAEQLRERDAQRVALFGAEATERLRAEEADWAAWQQRLDAARVRREDIARDPQRSALQRTQAQEADLTASFSGAELLRARGLLGADAH